jgi:hypothetical protein
MFHHVKDVTLPTREGPISLYSLRYIQGRDKSSVTLYLREESLTTSEEVDAFDAYTAKMAILVAGSLQRCTGIGLALCEVMQPPHYAIEAPEEVVGAALAEGIQGPETWADRSNGSPEMETSRASTAALWLTLEPTLQGLREDQEGTRDALLWTNRQVRRILHHLNLDEEEVKP